MYINTVTGQYPISEAEIRAEFPNTSFPVVFEAPAPYAFVFPSPATYAPDTQIITEAAPALTNKGHWEQTWDVTDKSAGQIAAEAAAAVQAFQTEVIAAAQARLDAFAKTRNYDGILSACTYASSTVLKFAAEGQRAVDLRDATWATLYSLMADVQAGTRTMPTTVEAVIALLPELTWPA